MRNRLIALVAALIVLVFLVVASLMRTGPRVSVVTTEATTGSIARQVLATATLEPARMVDVGSQVSGTISSLPVDFNSVVKAGQVVAELDPATYQSNLESARAALAQAQAQAAQQRTTLGDAETKFERAQALKKQDLIAQADFDTAQTTRDQAQANLKAAEAAIVSAQATVKQAEVDLERTVIRSPIDGVIVNRAVDIGQTVAATLQSPTFFTIADLKKMQLLTEINEGEVGGVQPGSPVSFVVESMGAEPFQGKVATVRLQPYAESTSTAGRGAATAIGTAGTSGGSTSGGGAGTSGGSNASTANASSATSASSSTTGTGPAAPGAVTYTAVIDVNNADGRLAPGTTAIVTVNSGSRQNVLRLPNTALSFRPSPAVLERTGQEGLEVESKSGGGGDRPLYVWKFENDKFVPIEVRTGLSDDRWTEMLSGNVQPGDQLVTSAAPTR